MRLLAILRHFYTDVVGRYWPPERRIVEEGYRTLPFPFDEIEAPPMVMAMSWRLEDLVGYVDTWSAMRAAEQAIGREPFDAFAREMAAAWGDPATARRIEWSLAMRVGRVTDADR